MASVIPETPVRLLHGNDRQAELIRQALAEPPVGPTQQQSWRRLKARSGRSGGRMLLPAVAAALVLAAFAALLHRPGAELPLSPELFSQNAPAPRGSVAEPAAVAREVVAVTSSPSRLKPTPRALGDSSSSAPAGNLDTAACAQLAKSADYGAATACYGRVARGGTMTSELALYEKARLEARALGNAPLALSTLDEHRRRFPGGVLTSEVAFTRIDLLMQLGKHAEALAAIDQGLRGALGRERAADLQLMRASLLASSGDCTAALQAVSAARQAGAHLSRLEPIERRCAPSAPEAP